MVEPSELFLDSNEVASLDLLTLTMFTIDYKGNELLLCFLGR